MADLFGPHSRRPGCPMLSFRKALAHAINLRHLGKVAHPDHTVATGGVVPRALSGHTPDIALRHDPELARRLLHDSGWGGEPFRLGIAVGTAVTALVREVAKMWRESMDLEMQEVEYPAGDPDALTDVSKRVNAQTAVWFPGYPDQETFLRLLAFGVVG